MYKKCWKCSYEMVELTSFGDSCRIDICHGVKYKNHNIIQGSVTHYPMIVKKTSKY